MTPIDIFWEDARKDVFCTKDEFVKMVENVKFVQWDETSAAAIVGNEIHVVGLRPGWVTRRAIRQGFVPLLRQHGRLTTRIPISKTRSCRFVERLGFKHVGIEGLDIIYSIERARHE